MLTRQHFDPETLAAMDEIAQLLHIKLSVNETSQTFKRTDEMATRAASPPAKRVMRAARSAAQELLEELFVRRDKRNLRELRLRHVPSLVEAVQAAALLARQARSANPEVHGLGVFEKDVHEPLRELTQRWKSSGSAP